MCGWLFDPSCLLLCPVGVAAIGRGKGGGRGGAVSAIHQRVTGRVISHDVGTAALRRLVYVAMRPVYSWMRYGGSTQPMVASVRMAVAGQCWSVEQ